MTPFAALVPYIEADAASFKTEILSISFAFTLSNEEDNPSTNTNGEFPALLKVPNPRIVTED